MAVNEIRVSRRRGGGAHVSQGRSYILLSNAELDRLIRDLSNLYNTDDCPNRADTDNRIGSD